MGDERNASDDDSTRFSPAGASDETRFTATPVRPPETRVVHAESTIAPGSLLGHTYRIEALLARGGMGEVYRARHSELNTLHAIKIILPELANNPRIVDLFRREASVLRTVRNDAVVAYDGVFRDENGRLYLVMEFVEGASLSKVYKQRPLESEEVRRLLDRAADGLAAAHEKGVIHRDISPDNIILPGRDLSQAKIIDFGISKMADPEAKTIVGDDFAGKYSYVSPEQLGMFGGEVDARSDIYSLGLVLAAAAIGEPLDMGMSPISVIEARRGVPDLSRVPADLRAELAAMLQPDPAKRPQSMRELIRRPPPSKERRDSRRAVVEEGRDRSAGRRKAAPSPRFGLAPVIGGLAVVALLAGAAGYWFLLRPAGQSTPAPTASAGAIAPTPPAATGGSQTASTTAASGAAASGSNAAPTTGQTAQDFINALKPTQSQDQPASSPGTTAASPNAPPAATPPAVSVTVAAAPDGGQTGAAGAGQPSSTAPAVSGAGAAVLPVSSPPATGQPSAPAEAASTAGAGATAQNATGAVASAPTAPETGADAAATTAAAPPANGAGATAAVDTAPPTAPTASTGTQTAMLPVPPDVSKLAADARRAVEGLSCARVRVDVAQNGDATASGYVGTEADRKRAMDGIAAVPGIGQVANSVAVMKWPLCEALGVLDEQATIGADQPAAPLLDPGGTEGTYREGDHLKIGVTATSAYDGYLYVDYVDAAEHYVVHLLPNELRPDNRVKAGQQVVIGTLPDEMKNYTVSPPFGTNMIVALSSPRPLFNGRRALLEQADDYLPALRSALKSMVGQVGQEKLLAASTSVTFKPR